MNHFQKSNPLKSGSGVRVSPQMGAAAAGLTKVVAAAVVKGVAEARAQIFGHILNPTAQRSAHKVLRKKLIGDKVSEWYPYDIKHDDPQIMLSQEQEYDTIPFSL